MIVIVEHLHLDLPHGEDAAVAAALAVTLHLAGGSPFEVELVIAKLLFAVDITGPWHALKGAVFYLPLGGFRRVCIRQPVVDRCVSSIEENHCIRWRFTGVFLGAGSRRLDARRQWTIHIVAGPRMRLIRWIAVKSTAGVEQSTEKWQGAGS